jgi:hypothetical protein
MGSPTLDLSPREQKALDALLARCSARRVSQSDLERCAIYKSTMAAKQQAIDADNAAIAAANAAQASETNSRDRLMAAGLVYQQITLLQNQAIQMLTAMMLAARDYDMIMAVRASKPITGDIILGLIISFAPEFAPLKRVLDALGIAKGQQPLLAIGLDRIGVEIRNGKSFGRVLVEKLDQRSNNLIKSFRDPINSRNSKDSESELKVRASMAMTKLMGEVMTTINDRLNFATVSEKALLQYCYWTVDPMSKVPIALKLCGLTFGPNDVVPLDKLTNLFLYDALRLYVKQYFVFHGQQGEAMADLLPHQDEGQVQGLDAAQREMIYDRFRKVPWTDPTRPPVDGFRDLLKYWGGTYVADQRPVGGFVMPAGI